MRSRAAAVFTALWLLGPTRGSMMTRMISQHALQEQVRLATNVNLSATSEAYAKHLKQMDKARAVRPLPKRFIRPERREPPSAPANAPATKEHRSSSFMSTAPPPPPKRGQTTCEETMPSESIPRVFLLPNSSDIVCHSNYRDTKTLVKWIVSGDSIRTTHDIMKLATKVTGRYDLLIETGDLTFPSEVRTTN